MNLVDDTTVGQAQDKQRLRIWLRLLRISRQMESEIRERLRVEFATTLPRFDVLAALYRETDGMKMSALSAALMVSNGNVTGIVNRLEDDGLIERTRRAGDRRTSVVRLTDAGASAFEEMAIAHEGWIDTAFAAVGGRDAERLAHQLEQARRELPGAR